MLSSQYPQSQDAAVSSASQSAKTTIRDTVSANLQVLSQVLPELQRDLDRYMRTGVPVITDDEDLLGSKIWEQDPNTLHAYLPSKAYQSITVRVTTHRQGGISVFLRSGVNDADFYSLSVDMEQGRDSELMLPSGDSLMPSEEWTFADKVVEDLRQSVSRIADLLGRQDLSRRL